MARDEQPGGPYLEAIQRAFQFARAQGRACDPADFLVGLAAGSGAAAVALDPGSGLSLADIAAVSGGPSRERGGWHVADRLGLDDDQRHSLVWQHAGQVAQLTARARTDLVGSVPRPGPPRRPGVTIGWAAWFDNRRVGLRDRWFRLRTSWHYRGCPEP